MARVTRHEDAENRGVVSAYRGGVNTYGRLAHGTPSKQWRHLVISSVKMAGVIGI